MTTRGPSFAAGTRPPTTRWPHFASPSGAARTTSSSAISSASSPPKAREFTVRWAKHDVRAHLTSQKVLHNAVIGDVELTCDALDLNGDGLILITYTAAPGSPAAEALGLLASWNSAPASRTQPHNG